MGVCTLPSQCSGSPLVSDGFILDQRQVVAEVSPGLEKGGLDEGTTTFTEAVIAADNCLKISRCPVNSFAGRHPAAEVTIAIKVARCAITDFLDHLVCPSTVSGDHDFLTSLVWLALMFARAATILC